MNAYQWKQEAFGAAVDRGLYNLASQIDETNAADFSGGIPWHIIRAIADEQQRLTPSKSPPERSGTTGHDTTLTRAQKCAIIVKKAIRRHVRRKIKCRRAKIMTIKINLTQDAYINSGECRLHTNSGKPSAWVLRDWYEAAATDADGNEYRVIWAIRDDWDASSGDESDACDWDNPAEIIRLSDGANVTDRAKINW